MTTEERLARRKQICGEANGIYNSGNAPEAANRFAECWALFGEDEKGSVDWASFCLGYGSALAESGNLKLAATMFDSAILAFLPLGKKGGLAAAYFNLGNVSANSNSLQGAFDNYTLAIQTYRADGDAFGEGQCLLNLAAMFFAMGAPARAQEYVKEFGQLDPAIRQDPEIGRSYWMQQARSELVDGLATDARNSLEQALALAEQTGVPAYIAETESRLAQVKAQLGEGPNAIAAIEKAYDQARLENSPQAIGAAATFAAALEQNGDAGRAVSIYRDGLMRVEQVRAQLDLSDRFRFMESASGIARSATRLLFGIKKYEEAFEASEHGQARATLDLMFRHQIKRQGSRVIRAGANGRPILDSPALAVVREDIDQSGIHLLKFYRGDKSLLAWLLKPRAPMAAWDASAALARLDELVALLIGANVQFEVSGDRAPLMEVRGGVPEGHPSWSEIDPALQAFWQALMPEDVRRYFEEYSGELVICPHRDTYFVPFSAVRLGSGEALCSRWRIAVAPSAGVFLQLDPRRDAENAYSDSIDRGALAIGGCSSQAFSVPRIPGRPEPSVRIGFRMLPGTSVEAGRVVHLMGGQVLIGAQATPSAVLELMGSYRVLHIASHGFWDPSGDISLVVLEGGYLSAGDVAQYTLRSDLTVLSACQTGLGMPHPDSYTGLAQSFLIGGTRAVLTTLWPVGDSATLFFMENFYGALKRDCSPAEALVRAQAAVRDNSDLSDGYNWAGFQLLGRPFGPATAGALPFDGPVCCGGDLVLMGATPGEAVDLEPCRDAIQNSSEALIFRDGHIDKIRKK